MTGDSASLKAWLGLALVPLAIFGVFYVAPVLQLFWLSLSRFDPAIGIIPAMDLGYFIEFLTDGYYVGILGGTVLIRLMTTVATALLAYPLAIYLLTSKGWRQTGLLIALVLPL